MRVLKWLSGFLSYLNAGLALMFALAAGLAFGAHWFYAEVLNIYSPGFETFLESLRAEKSAFKLFLVSGDFEALMMLVGISMLSVMVCSIVAFLIWRRLARIFNVLSTKNLSDRGVRTAIRLDLVTLPRLFLISFAVSIADLAYMHLSKFDMLMVALLNTFEEKELTQFLIDNFSGKTDILSGIEAVFNPNFYGGTAFFLAIISFLCLKWLDDYDRVESERTTLQSESELVI